MITIARDVGRVYSLAGVTPVMPVPSVGGVRSAPEKPRDVYVPVDVFETRKEADLRRVTEEAEVRKYMAIGQKWRASQFGRGL